MKLVTLKHKESKGVERIQVQAAEKLVQDGDYCFVRKGVYKRIVKDNLKAKTEQNQNQFLGLKL